MANVPDIIGKFVWALANYGGGQLRQSSPTPRKSRPSLITTLLIHTMAGGHKPKSEGHYSPVLSPLTPGMMINNINRVSKMHRGQC